MFRAPDATKAWPLGAGCVLFSRRDIMRSLGHAFVLGLVAASMHAGEARADTWPIGRHDAARTGASPAVVPIKEPIVTWQAFMGGRPTALTVQFGIQDQTTMAAAVGGRFI